MSQVTATAVAQQLVVTSSGDMVIQNLDAANPVYIGKSASVTATGANGGLRIGPGQALSWSVGRVGSTGTVAGPYVVCAAGQTAVVALDIQ